MLKFIKLGYHSFYYTKKAFVYSFCLFISFAVASEYKDVNNAKFEANNIIFSGNVELDVFSKDIVAEEKVELLYASKIDLNLDVILQKKWSAYLSFKADGLNDSPSVFYDAAYVMYKESENIFLKVGDISFFEGPIIFYYKYDDPIDWAAGMVQQDIRGLELNLFRFNFGMGLVRNVEDFVEIRDKRNLSYNFHLAYNFHKAGFYLRPYMDYSVYQGNGYDAFHAGTNAMFVADVFSAHLVYGLHADYLRDDDSEKSVGKSFDLTSVAHSFLLETSLDLNVFQLRSSIFYAIINSGDVGNMEIVNDILEYCFAYVEPLLKLSEYLKLGVPIEFHTNALDTDVGLATLDTGFRIYLDPMENFNLLAFAMVGFPIDSHNENDYESIMVGVESVYSW